MKLGLKLCVMIDWCLLVLQMVFEDVYAARDSATLEQLKELSSKRRVIEESINESSFITEAIAREMYGGLTSQIQQVNLETRRLCSSIVAPFVVFYMINLYFALIRVLEQVNVVYISEILRKRLRITETFLVIHVIFA